MTREELGVLVENRKKVLNNSEFSYCEYFDEYDKLIESNPCNSIHDFINGDIWDIVKCWYQTTDPLTSFEENEKYIDSFKDFIDGMDTEFLSGIICLVGQINDAGILDDVIDFLDEKTVIKGLLKLNKINFKDSDLREIVITSKQAFKEDLSALISLFKFYSGDSYNVDKMLGIIISHKGLKHAKTYTSEILDMNSEFLRKKDKKRCMDDIDKLYKDICDTKGLMSEIGKIRILVNEQKEQAKKYERNIRKELNGYDRAIGLLDLGLKKKEITNAREIIKNVKDEELKKAFLQVIYEHNMKYYEELESEYNKLNENDSNKYKAILKDNNISFNEEDLKSIMMMNTTSDVSNMIKILNHMGYSENRLDILKNTSLSMLLSVKNYLDKGYISRKYLIENKEFMYDRSNMLKIFENNISYLNSYNLNPALFINITDIIVRKGDIFNSNLNILNKYGLLKNIRTTNNFLFLGDNNLTDKIDKYLELGYEEFLDIDLGILNLSNLKRLEVLKSINMPISELDDLYSVLNDKKFIINDSVLDEYLPNVVEYASKKDISCDNLDDYKQGSRVYNIGGNLFSINKVNRLIDNGSSMYDALFSNRKFNEEEYSSTLKALDYYESSK